jgi:hypothetical protein
MWEALKQLVSATMAKFSSSPPPPKEDCPPPKTEETKKAVPWELRVRVKSQDASRQPQNITVTLETLVGGSGSETIKATTEEFKAKEGTGARKFKVTASADKWELVAAQEETLNDGDKKTVVVELRPKPWELRVRVKSQEATRWPKDVTLTLEALAGSSGNKTRSLSMNAQTEELKEEGKGDSKFKITASAEKWELVSAQEVTLADGDQKQVELELRPKAWIAFKVMYKDKVVSDVTLKLTLPGDRKETPVTTDKETRYDDLSAGTCTLEELSHAELWEVEELTSA